MNTSTRSRPAHGIVAPHSLCAERAVLGAVLVRNEVLTDVLDVLAPEDFWRAAHQVIYRHMVALAQAGRPIDLVTLSADLEREGELETVGGPAYVTGLVDGVPRSTNAPHYAEQVRDYAQRRKCLLIADQLRADAAGAEDVHAAIATTERALRDLETGRITDVVTAADAAHAGLDALEASARAEHGITGVPTGLPTLDRMLGGLQPGELIVIAARPSIGKTALATQLAHHAALQRRVPVLFVTLEQRAPQLALRMASNASRVDLVAMREQLTTEDEVARLHDALASLADAPLRFIDDRDVRMSEVRRHARHLHGQGLCGMVVLDYLGLVRPEQASARGETREAQVAAQSRLAKSIARELGVPFVLLCQLNREVERDTSTRTGAARRPRLSDLRESGAIEQDADVVVFVHRPFARPTTPEEHLREGETELVVAKQRNGPTGLIDARYERAWTRFFDTGGEGGA